MAGKLVEIFADKDLVEKIKRRLSYLFQLAELESSRAGSIGMEVGSVREKIIVALFIYKFGGSNIETEIPITESEVDAKLFGEPVSIKTITGKSLGGVKLIWTVDAQKAIEFRKNYYPSCDILLVQINWGNAGGFFYIPVGLQRKLLNKMSSDNYIKLPKAGTNPRGAEITREALSNLVADKQCQRIMIEWQEAKIDFNPYKKWVDFWKED